MVMERNMLSLRKYTLKYLVGKRTCYLNLVSSGPNMHINIHTLSHSCTYSVSNTQTVLHAHTLSYSHKRSQPLSHQLSHSHTFAPHTCTALKLKGVEERTPVGGRCLRHGPGSYAHLHTEPLTLRCPTFFLMTCRMEVTSKTTSASTLNGVCG